MSDANDNSSKIPNTWLTYDMLEYLKVHRFDGSWEEITKAFNKKFKESRTTDAVRLMFGRTIDTDLSGEEFKWWTRNAFSATTVFTEKQARYFVTGIMPLHTITKDGYDYTYNHVNMDAFRTLLAEQENSGQRPVILPMKAHTAPLQTSPSVYDPALTPWKDWFTAEAEFNANIRAVDMRVNPQQMQPLTNMEKADPDSSIFIASPRQNLEIIATGNETPSRLLRSTGVLNYAGYQPNRIGRLAEKAHTLGGIVLEVDGKLFHQRRVSFDEKGGYYDLDRYVHFSGDSTSRVEMLAFGDCHFGQGNEGLHKLALSLIAKLQPKIVLIPDGFDGLSINHHLNMIDKIARPDWAYSLETEAAVVRKHMNEMRDAAPIDCQFVWQYDNHGDFLGRYLKNRSYFNDEVNFKKAHELQLVLLAGGNPLTTLLNLPHVKYLGPNDDLFVKGWQFANHGHMGVNGARGSRPTVGKTANKVVQFHTHTPFEKDNHIGAGMWTNPRHGYNKGASTWLPSCVICHPDGSIQQIIAIKKPGTKDTYVYCLED